MKAIMLGGAALMALAATQATAQAGTSSTSAGVAAPQASHTPPADTGQRGGEQQPNDQQVGGAPRDIVVTAQRRAEAIQDVPIAISVFESADRDRRGIRTIQDFSNFTPGLTFSSSLDRLSLRGIGRLTNTIGSDPGVAIYNDGFYTASNAEASKTPMFVDRVEFLRGPQGTLYGRNSVGGAINVISKRPTDTFGGEWRVTVDNLSVLSEGYLSGPIVGGLKARVSVQMGPRKIDTRTTNIATTATSRDEGFQNRFLVEGQLQYDFSDKTQLWFKYSHAEWRDSNPTGFLASPYVTDDIDGAAGNSLTPAAAFGYGVASPGVTDERKINTNTLNQARLTNNHNFVVNFTSELGGVAIKYVGGYSQYKYQGLSDLDYTAQNLVVTSFGSAPIAALAPFGAANAFRTYSYNPTYVQDYREDKKYYSNELTLASATPGRFNWIVGAYQFHEKYFQPVTWFVDGDAGDTLSQRIAAPICLSPTFAVVPDCPTNPRRAFYEGSGDLRTNSYAGFGQADYELLAGLKATVGLRYSYDKKRGFESYRVINWQPAGASTYCTLTPGANATVVGFGGCGAAAAAQDLTRFLLGLPGAGAATRTLEDSWDGLSWRFGLDWKPDRDTLVFASYSRGLKAGGFNLGSYADSPEVTKERVDAFELGLKSRPVRPLTLNVTGFYYDYRNAQIPIVVGRAASTLTTTNFFNIDKSRSWGVEMESAWNVTDAFELSANYSFNDTKILRAPRRFDDEGSPGTVLEDITGNRLPAASKHKVAVSALYDFPTGEGDHVYLAASYVYRSDAYYAVFENPINRAPGWDQVDARITYTRPRDGLTVIAFARNLFDTVGYDGAFSTGATNNYRQIYSYTFPRQVGVELQFKF